MSEFPGGRNPRNTVDWEESVIWRTSWLPPTSMTCHPGGLS